MSGKANTRGASSAELVSFHITDAVRFTSAATSAPTQLTTRTSLSKISYFLAARRHRRDSSLPRAVRTVTPAGARGASRGWCGAPPSPATMDSDSEDFVVVGTPLEREEEDRAYRKKVRDLATTRSLPVHKQVPVDAQGRARFHGAFEGGFSAGYFNTVGSKEGWAPSQFRSSRGDRAAPSARVAEDYMDDDEREALQASRLEARDDYDTFGTAAALKAQRQHSAAAAPDRVKGGGGIIPGPVPSDLVVPVSDPKAQRLLRRMGWRPGKGIGRKHASRPSPLADDRDHDSDRSDAEDDALPAALADDVRGFVLVPKTNLHGRRLRSLRRRRGVSSHRGRATTRSRRGPARDGRRATRTRPSIRRGRLRGGRSGGGRVSRGRRGDEVGHAYEIDDSEPSDDEFDRGVGAHAGASGAINGLLGDGERANDRGRMGSAGASGRDAGSGTAVRGFALSGDTLAPTRWYPPPTVPRSFTGRHVFSSSATKPPPRIKVVGRASATPHAARANPRRASASAPGGCRATTIRRRHRALRREERSFVRDVGARTSARGCQVCLLIRGCGIGVLRVAIGALEGGDCGGCGGRRGVGRGSRGDGTDRGETETARRRRAREDVGRDAVGDDRVARVGKREVALDGAAAGRASRGSSPAAAGAGEEIGGRAPSPRGTDRAFARRSRARSRADPETRTRTAAARWN